MTFRCCLWFVLGLCLSACAATAPMSGQSKPSPDSDHAEMERLQKRQQELVSRMQELQTGSAAATSSCQAICGWTQNISELSERICRIAVRHPGEVEFKAACAQAKLRCARARAKAGRTCNCGAT